MAEFSYPFDTGSGASVTQAQWQHMAQYFEASGVCGDSTSGFLKVTAPATGMTTVVAPGDAFVKGFFYYSDANISVTHTNNTSGNPRIDLVILRLDTVAKTITVQHLEGSPNATPVAPTPTFPAFGGGTVFEIPLAQVRVESGTSVIAANKVTDTRMFTTPVNSYVNYTPSITDSNGGTSINNTFGTKVGRYRVSDRTVEVWGMIKATDTLVVSGTAPAVQIGLPFASANLGANADQLINIMFRASAAGDMRTGWGCVFAGSSKMDRLAIQNKTSGDLDYFLTNGYVLGDIIQWTGTYEIAGP